MNAKITEWNRIPHHTWNRFRLDNSILCTISIQLTLHLSHSLLFHQQCHGTSQHQLHLIFPICEKCYFCLIFMRERVWWWQWDGNVSNQLQPFPWNFQDNKAHANTQQKKLFIYNYISFNVCLVESYNMSVLRIIAAARFCVDMKADMACFSI